MEIIKIPAKGGHIGGKTGTIAMSEIQLVPGIKTVCLRALGVNGVKTGGYFDIPNIVMDKLALDWLTARGMLQAGSNKPPAQDLTTK